MFIKKLITYHKKKKNALRTRNADVQSMPQYDTRKQILKKICSWKKIFFGISVIILTNVLAVLFIKPLISVLPLYPVFLVGGLVIYSINFLGIMYEMTNIRLILRNIDKQTQKPTQLIIKQGKKSFLFLSIHFMCASTIIVSIAPLWIFPISIFIGGKILRNYLLPKAEAGTLPTWIYRWLGRTKPSISNVMQQSTDDDIPQLENRSS